MSNKDLPTDAAGRPGGRKVDVDEEVRAIVDGAAAKRTDLTGLQKAAAGLLGRTLDLDVVEKVYELESGQVSAWLREDVRFATAAVQARLTEESYAAYPVDLAAPLSERQRKAAELLATGRYTDVEAARELRITDRTIRNWKKEPTFRLYRDHCAGKERFERDRKQKETTDLIAERFSTLALELLSVAAQELRGGNAKAAAELLKVVYPMVK